MIDLEQRGEQRMGGLLPYSKTGEKIVFQEPSFTPKSSVLFRAP
jgi:hypothetical protein